jgi:short-subunit dehydrogenase
MLEYVYSLLWFLLALVVFLLVVSFFFPVRLTPLTDYNNKHVLITGGSAGLGKALAKIVAKKGANVTIIARSTDKLKIAQQEIQKSTVNKNQKIIYFAADVTKFQDINEAINKALIENGAIDLLIANAGSSTPGYFVDLTVESMKKEFDLNYFGVIHTIKAALPSMIEKSRGHISIISSAAAFIDFVGYTNYAASKRALAAFAEGLRHEMVPHKIDVSCYFPTNIDTDCFVEENKTKPAEAVTIEGAHANTPESVAQSLIDGFASGRFAISNEFMTELLRASCNGNAAPRHNVVLDLVLQIVGILIHVPTIRFFDYIMTSSKKKKN